MEWLNTLLQPEILALLIAIVAVFLVATRKAHHRHQERIENIKNGFNPD
ncbi:hypothetical protein H4J58_13045 [Colwellia sp. MB3u-70]|nr:MULTISPECIES: hypothetical protein [unclassified Colwellia]MBA6293478.1 hypothetical protein [Colwellia sp. MB3u-8]MBA6308040.1 hypothetical protein [Colwellia sp. MB3u-70]